MSSPWPISLSNGSRPKDFAAISKTSAEGRFNTIGVLRGKGGGKTIIFNSHLDSDVVVPRVAIGVIRGGFPFNPSVGVNSCSIYVDVRVPPPMSFSEAKNELREVVSSQGFGGDVQMYMARRGYEGKNVAPLVAAIRKSHQAIRGNDCPPVWWHWIFADPIPETTRGRLAEEKTIR